MNDFLPDELPPVSYFLMEINNETWYGIFRILFTAIVIISALIYLRYRKSIK